MLCISIAFEANFHNKSFFQFSSFQFSSTKILLGVLPSKYLGDSDSVDT